MSLKLDGNWNLVSDNSLPPGLQVKVKANGNGNGRGRGKIKHHKDTISIGKLF